MRSAQNRFKKLNRKVFHLLDSINPEAIRMRQTNFRHLCDRKILPKQKWYKSNGILILVFTWFIDVCIPQNQSHLCEEEQK